MNEWMNERLVDQWRMIEWTKEVKKEWKNEWNNEWINKRMIEWKNEWMNECTKERMNESTNERMNECLLYSSDYKHQQIYVSYWQLHVGT